MVPPCSMESAVHGTETRIHTGTTLGGLRACHKQENVHVMWNPNKWRPTAVAAIQQFPSPTPPDSPFLRALGTTAALKAPPQTDTLAQRAALEEWERTKAVAILATIIHKDGGEMLIAIALDRPLAEAKELVDDPTAFTREMTRILREKQNHPLIAQMMKPAESGDPPPANTAASSAGSREPRTTSHVQFQ